MSTKAKPALKPYPSESCDLHDVVSSSRITGVLTKDDEVMSHTSVVSRHWVTA